MQSTDMEIMACEWDVLDCPIPIVIAKSKAYITQKSISDLLSLSIKTINEHITTKDFNNQAELFYTKSIEGGRLINRKRLHYPLACVKHIAIVSGKVQEYNRLVLHARRYGLFDEEELVCPRKEHNFCVLLADIFSGITTIYQQYRVRNWRLDFYLPELKLAIEYDEEYHKYSSHKDSHRQDSIEKILGCTFLRVQVGQETEAINKIVRMLLSR